MTGFPPPLPPDALPPEADVTVVVADRDAVEDFVDVDVVVDC